MSKGDLVTNGILLNPYIEIGKGVEHNPNLNAHINVSTFEECFKYLIPPFTDKGPTFSKKEVDVYLIYAVIGRTVLGNGKTQAYLNVDEPPISRTLIGLLSENTLKIRLPKVYADLNAIKI